MNSLRAHSRARALLVSFALGGPLVHCATRTPGGTNDMDVIEVAPCDPRVPALGEGHNLPSCAPESVIDVNAMGIRSGNEIHVRVDTRNRRNELHPSCVDRDSSEAVLRYTAPPDGPGGTGVRALMISTANCATQFDTVLSVRNDCGPEYHDYTCNNDGFTVDGVDTRKSTVYYTDLAAEQFVYIIVDGYDGSAGLADLVITEITDVGSLGAPCIPVPSSMAMDPNAGTAGFRCPHDGIRCQPGAAADGTDLCLPLLGLGAPCDPDEHRNVCEVYSARHVLCAQNPNSRTEAICALPGTAPGALCRTAQPRCDGRLACSPGIGFQGRDICVPLRALGSTCDPQPVGFSDKCDTGLVCCGDGNDAGANFTCRSMGWSPCFAYMPPSE